VSDTKDDIRVLDATCGGRTMWTEDNKDRGDVLYTDCRQEEPGFHGQEGRTYSVDPDVVTDVRRLPFSPGTFDLAVYDPPHMVREDGMKQLSGNVIKKYGALRAETWQSDIHDAVTELFRVLSDAGTLVFKFADVDTSWDDVLSALPVDPLFGTTSKKKTTHQTRWFTLHAAQYNGEDKGGGVSRGA
jgi:hypothetical protein